MSVRKVVGDVTAYAAAVKGGYTGTYEQFCADQANFAKNASDVAENLAQSKEILDNAKSTIEAEAISAANTAKDRINAAANERLGDFDAVGAVRFDRQELSQTQKEQAKANVDAGGAIICESSGETVTIADASDQPLRGLKLYGKSVQNGTPTPENPVEIKNTVVSTISSVSKNLLDESSLEKGRWTNSNGVLVKVDDDEFIRTSKPFKLSPNTQYYVTFPHRYGFPDRWNVMFCDKNLNLISAIDWTYDNAWFKTINHECYVLFQCSYVGDYSNDIMLNIGTTALPYEPYKGGSVTLAQPVTLPGIPVSSGGNYTDANGQQWLCDEMDFARGVYVQRVGKVDLGEQQWNQAATSEFYADIDDSVIATWEGYACLCTKYARSAYPDVVNNGEMVFATKRQSNTAGRLFIVDSTYTDPEAFKASVSGVMLYYELATPVETPISETDLTAYRTLHTNKPNTTVYTDSNAGLTVAYAADTKTYIDNKFAELAAAVLQNA